MPSFERTQIKGLNWDFANDRKMQCDPIDVQRQRINFIIKNWAKEKSEINSFVLCAN